MRAVAIVNAHARGLVPKLRARLERELPGNVRFTDSLDEARTTIRAEIRRGTDLVILGGGDGTVVMGLTLLGEACRGFGKREPMIAVLRMGSGNAIADTVGASDDVVADLSRLSRGGGTRRLLPLLDVLGTAGIVAVLAIFMLVQSDLPKRISALFALRGSRISPRALAEAGELVSGFLVRQAFVCALQGVIVAIGLALKAVAHGWTVRELEAAARDAQNPSSKPVSKSAKKSSAQDPDIAALERELAEKLAAKVSIRHGRGGKGQLVIGYHSVEELEGILERIR